MPPPRRRTTGFRAAVVGGALRVWVMGPSPDARGYGPHPYPLALSVADVGEVLGVRLGERVEHLVRRGRAVHQLLRAGHEHVVVAGGGPVGVEAEAVAADEGLVVLDQLLVLRVGD